MFTLHPENYLHQTLAISLLTLLWMGACAFCDARTHQVSNWLTLPAIPLALLAAWLTRESHTETMFKFGFHLVILIVALLAAWSNHLIGGADLKILLVLSLANPLLLIAAWTGVMAYFLGLVILQHNRPVRFAGAPGFALGIGLFTLIQAALQFMSHLAA